MKDILTYIIIAGPIFILLSLHYYYRIVLKRRILENKRSTWCKYEGKRIDSFKTDISSPKFKSYVLTFTDQFGNEFEIITEDKEIYNSFKKGQTGILTHGIGYFISFEQDSK